MIMATKMGAILASIRGFSTPPLPISMSELLPQIKRHISSRKVSSFFHAINPGEIIFFILTFTSSMVTPLIPASPFEQLFNDSSTQTRSIFQALRILRLIKEPTQTWELYKNPPLKDHASTSKEEAVNTIEVETSSPPTRRHRSGKEEVMKKFFESVLATPTLIGNTMLWRSLLSRFPRLIRQRLSTTKDQNLLDMRSWWSTTRILTTRISRKQSILSSCSSSKSLHQRIESTTQAFEKQHYRKGKTPRKEALIRHTSKEIRKLSKNKKQKRVCI